MINKLKGLWQHKGFIRYFKNTAWMFGEHMLRLLSGLFVGVWIARYLGPEKLGVFSYSVAFSALFSGIAKLGLDSIVVRELVKNQEDKTVILGTAFWLKVVGALIAWGGVATTTLLINNDYSTKLYIMIISAGMVFQSFEIASFYFQSRVLSKFISISKLIQLSISMLVKVYLVYIQADLLWFVCITLLDQITLQFCLLLSFHWQKGPRFYASFDRRYAAKLISASWPLILSSLMMALYMKIDQIMIKQMLNEKAVGIYSAAVKISEIWYFVPVLLCNSLFPAIVSAKKINESLYVDRIQKLFNLMVAVSICVAVPMTFFSKQIILFLYGSAYLDSSPVLSLHIWSGVFFFIGWTAGQWFVTENLQFLSFIRTLTGAIINIFLNLICIRRFGILGAALATVLSQFAASYIFNLFSQKTRILFEIQTRSLLFLGVRKS